MKLTFAALLASAFVASPPALAASGILGGITSSEIVEGDHNVVAQMHADHGDEVVLIPVHYSDPIPSQTYVNDRVADAAALVNRGILPYVRISGWAESAPLTAAKRTQFCDYALDVANKIRAVGSMDILRVSIWNEPNDAFFWPQTGNPPVEYARLLKACYAELSGAGHRVAAFELSSGKAPVPFIQGAATEMGGVPYFNIIAHHPYPYRNDDPVDLKRSSGWRLGDYDRVQNNFLAWFGARQVVWYTEYGHNTGSEPFDPPLSEDDQACQLISAWVVAMNQPKAWGFLNYRLTDAGEDNGWSTGLLEPWAWPYKGSWLMTQDWPTTFGREGPCGPPYQVAAVRQRPSAPRRPFPNVRAGWGHMPKAAALSTRALDRRGCKRDG